MKHSHSSLSILALGLCFLAMSVAAIAATQDFDLSWHTIDGGGETFSASVTYELAGTIGQTDALAGASMSGGDFILTGGFWAFSAEPPSPGDIDGDGDVDAVDLAALLGDWGACPGCPADLDGDGDVDAADLAILLGHWGP